MARRTVLTSWQRSALFALPQREADLLRHYTLSDEDLQNIGARRRPSNKLGFALQLCVLRYPGRLLAPGGAFPISRSRAHTHRRHGHPLQTVPSAGLIERPQEKNRVDALR